MRKHQLLPDVSGWSHKLGIQADPELTVFYCDALLTDRQDRIGAKKVSVVTRSLDHATDDNVLIKWILQFLVIGRVNA